MQMNISTDFNQVNIDRADRILNCFRAAGSPISVLADGQGIVETAEIDPANRTVVENLARTPIANLKISLVA